MIINQTQYIDLFLSIRKILHYFQLTLYTFYNFIRRWHLFWSFIWRFNTISGYTFPYSLPIIILSCWGHFKSNITLRMISVTQLAVELTQLWTTRHRTVTQHTDALTQNSHVTCSRFRCVRALACCMTERQCVLQSCVNVPASCVTAGRRVM